MIYNIKYDLNITSTAFKGHWQPPRGKVNFRVRVTVRSLRDRAATLLDRNGKMPFFPIEECRLAAEVLGKADKVSLGSDAVLIAEEWWNSGGETPV